jgi:hypothetical protein
MLEDFTSPAIAQQLRSCIPAPQLDAWCAQLTVRGYARATIRQKLWVVSALTRWLADEQLTLGDLDERRIATFLARRRRWGVRGARVTLLALLEHVRAAGVVPGPAPASDETPRVPLVASQCPR